MANHYTALVLDEASRVLLAKLFKPRHARVFLDHVTLEFEPTAPVDKEFRGFARVTGYAEDGAGQALECTVDFAANSVRAPSQRTHITVSTAKDVPPQYTKGMEFKPLSYSVVVCGVVRTVERD